VEGKGTKFELWLPVAKVAGSTKTVTFGEIANVLLLDDDDEWAQNFLKVLADAGINASRQDKLDNLPKADLIFVDEHSASLSMDEVLATVKRAGLADKTIVVTAAFNPERVTYYLREGLRDVQPKPYTAEEMAALLK